MKLEEIHGVHEQVEGFGQEVVVGWIGERRKGLRLAGNAEMAEEGLRGLAEKP